MTDAETFLYLTTLGRTSGAPRDIEIWFVERAGRYYVVSGARGESGWVKNLEREPRIRFSVGTPDAHEATAASAAGRARTVTAEGDPELVGAVRALMDAKYGWSDGLVVELARD
jgi:deazaflavin-dependent oxidoreductase (nitroreductase family)